MPSRHKREATMSQQPELNTEEHRANDAWNADSRPEFPARSLSSIDNFDVVIVGSGINSLVCAAMLVRKGKRVCVLERNAVAGGCIRTEEITAPGFRHDLFSMSYPLFVTAPHYPVLKDELQRGGLRFVSGGGPTAVVA